MKWISAFLVLLFFSCQKTVTIHNPYFSDTSQKLEVTCPDQTENTMVMYTFGQSNAANVLSDKYNNTDPRIINYYKGRCYVATDPLLGASDAGGSQWVELGERLLQTGQYDVIVINAFGLGGTSIKEWTGDKKLKNHFYESIQTIYNPTHYLWHQGEADNRKMSRETYLGHMRELIDRSLSGNEANFYVSVASRCSNEPDPNVRQAQMDVVDNDRVFQGPDTDSILDRNDGCHFNAAGRTKVVDQWINILSGP